MELPLATAPNRADVLTTPPLPSLWDALAAAECRSAIRAPVDPRGSAAVSSEYAYLPWWCEEVAVSAAVAAETVAVVLAAVEAGRPDAALPPAFPPALPLATSAGGGHDVSDSSVNSTVASSRVKCAVSCLQTDTRLCDSRDTDKLSSSRWVLATIAESNWTQYRF